jgi:hypothetical protein
MNQGLNPFTVIFMVKSSISPSPKHSLPTRSLIPLEVPAEKMYSSNVAFQLTFGLMGNFAVTRSSLYELFFFPINPSSLRVLPYEFGRIV